MFQNQQILPIFDSIEFLEYDNALAHLIKNNLQKYCDLDSLHWRASLFQGWDFRY
jgi:hypothetical protein